jgi:hypothetical protein
MKSLFENASQIIQAASAGTLGVYVFCIFVTSVLVFLLFRKAHVAVRVGAFVATLVLTACVLVLVQRSPGPRPVTNDEWTHYSSKSASKVADFLNLASPDPKDVAANCTIAGDISVWYRGGNTGARYRPASLDWRPEDHPKVNFFYNDGTIVPIGWCTTRADNFAYFEVSGSHATR